MKMYKKSDLTITNGILVSKDGDIVLPSFDIVCQANNLETMLQQSCYLKKQPEATPMPSLDGFERMSESDKQRGKFYASTPTMDSIEKEAMKVMDEIDDMSRADQANSMIEQFGALFDFVVNDFVIDCGHTLTKFDTPVMGSVLDLTKDKLLEIVASICGMSVNVDDGDDNDEEDLKEIGGIAIPATKDNIDKIKEFFKDLANDAAGHDASTASDIVSSLQEVSNGINDVCNQIEDNQYKE